MKFVTGRTLPLLIVACILPTGSVFAKVDYYREIQPMFDHYQSFPTKLINNYLQFIQKQVQQALSFSWR